MTCRISKNRAMSLDRWTKTIHDACIRMGKYQPHELLGWLVGDVLAGFGVRQAETPPDDLTGWLREVSGQYARAVADNLFGDVLGGVYQMLGSRGHRKGLGQFFTPGPIAQFMAALVAPAKQEQPRQPGQLLRMCEPACGRGALMLAFMQAIVERDGSDALCGWSMTGIDLDHLCARMCAAQVLATLLLHRLSVGELVVYRGNALGSREQLGVLVHTTVADLMPDVVLPAMHPSRIEALRSAARSQAGIGPPTAA